MRFQVAGDQDRAEGGMIDIRVAGNDNDIKLADISLFEVVFVCRQERNIIIISRGSYPAFVYVL